MVGLNDKWRFGKIFRQETLVTSINSTLDLAPEEWVENMSLESAKVWTYAAIEYLLNQAWVF